MNDMSVIRQGEEKERKADESSHDSERKVSPLIAVTDEERPPHRG